MTIDYDIIGNILFSQSLLEIQQHFEFLKKDSFDPLDRIVIRQDTSDEYPYIDGVGTKLIEIQKIINQVDISNCFILLVTPNTDISREIDFVTRFYSVDPKPIGFQIIDGYYEKTIKKYSNTACQKLWNHFYLGTDGNINPCCIADHRFSLGNIDEITIDNIISDKADQIRNNMMQGHRVRACSTCYEKEDSGIQSNRQTCDPNNMKIDIRDIDIRLNNICNFKCRMCSEYFSSAIQQETIELYGKDAVLGFEKTSLEKTTKYTKNQRLEKILPLVTCDLESIYFAGGEPLITNEHYEILDQLIAINNTDIAIRYSTNLSTLCYKQTNVIDKWCRFSDITVAASIDASGVVGEYMRHGTVWTDIVNNIHIIKQDVPHVKLKITSTVSCLTIENLIDLQNFWINQQLFKVEDFEVQVLTKPNFFSPAVLPRHHKDRLSNIIQTHIRCLSGTRLAKQWHDVLQWMNNNDYTFALKDFAHRTHVLDAHRNESFEDIFPEYKDLI
jgi:hypothetical protein